MTVKNLNNSIFALIKDIWGPARTKQGYNWVAAKFGRLNLNHQPVELLENIITCLESKRWQVLCPLHSRVHDTRP